MLTGRQHTRPSRRGGGHYTVYPIFILSFIIVTTLPACSPKIIERIVVQHDTTTVHHRDTTYHRDSMSPGLKEGAIDSPVTVMAKSTPLMGDTTISQS